MLGTSDQVHLKMTGEPDQIACVKGSLDSFSHNWCPHWIFLWAALHFFFSPPVSDGNSFLFFQSFPPLFSSSSHAVVVPVCFFFFYCIWWGKQWLSHRLDFKYVCLDSSPLHGGSIGLLVFTVMIHLFFPIFKRIGSNKDTAFLYFINLLKLYLA